MDQSIASGKVGKVTQSLAVMIFTAFVLKVKGLDTCYRAAYMCQTQEQQGFRVSEVAADWHELMILQGNAL